MMFIVITDYTPPANSERYIIFYNKVSDWTNYIRYYFISELFNDLEFKFNK